MRVVRYAGGEVSWLGLIGWRPFPDSRRPGYPVAAGIRSRHASAKPFTVAGAAPEFHRFPCSAGLEPQLIAYGRLCQGVRNDFQKD